jgi:hypothetical protein
MSPKTKKTPRETNDTPVVIARWMLKELEKQNGVLYQEEAAPRIAELFGEDFVCESDAGNACIKKEILSAFRRLTGDHVVWSRGDRLWRRREEGDAITRQQE